MPHVAGANCMDSRHITHRTQTALVDRCLFGALLLLLIWLPIPWGSNRPLAMATIGVWANGLLLLAIVLRLLALTRWPTLHAPFIGSVAFWIAWMGWLGLSLVPLPISFLQTLNPEIVSFKEPLHVSSAPWSLAPGKTLEQLLLTEAYFALFLTTWMQAGSRKRQRWVLQVLVVSGAVQAMYGSFMVITGWSLGAFGEAKTAYLNAATGTFVNRNHLAGYIELCGAAALGLLWMDLGGGQKVSWRARVRSWLALMGSNKLLNRVLLASLVIGLIMTRSRMGNIAFFAGLAVAGLLVLLLHERRYFVRGVLLLSSLVIVDLSIVSQWYGLDVLRDRIEQTQYSTDARAQVFPEFMPIIRDYWVTGAGAGTFAQLFPHYQSASVVGYWDHAHNDYAEIVIETGFIGAMLLGGLGVFVLIHAINVLYHRQDRRRVGVAVAVVMALTSFVLHSVFDFNLQIPANAATLVVLLALAATITTQKGGHLARQAGMRYKK